MTRPKAGRHNITGARAVAFDEPPPARGRYMATIAVDEPGEPPKIVEDATTGEFRAVAPRIQVRANIAGDTLALELKRGLINQAQFDVGRHIERVLAQGHATGGGQWREGDRVDAASAHEHAIAANVDRARRAVDMMRQMRDALGVTDARVMVQVLIEGMSYMQVAAIQSRASDREAKHWAWAFRRALQTMSDVWMTARGAAPRHPLEPAA